MLSKLCGHAPGEERDRCASLCLKMIEGQPQLVEHPMFIDCSEVLRCDKTGIFYPLVEKGHTVVNGALIGYVTDFFGKGDF